MEYVQSYTHREIHSPEFFLKEQKSRAHFPQLELKHQRHLREQNSEETSAGWFRLLWSCLAEEGPGLRDPP